MSVFRGAGGGAGGLKDSAGNAVSFSGSKTRRLKQSAASTNAERVKNGPGTIDGLKARNTAAYPIFVHVYDSVAAPPAVNADAARDVFEFPAGVLAGWGPPGGIDMETGIGMAIVKADGSAVLSGDLTNFTLWYR